MGITKRIDLSWAEQMRFEVQTESGHSLTLDAREDVGGQNRGPRPSEVVLAGLAGCTSMDVISILRKMRLPVEQFTVTAVGEEREEHPKSFHTIVVSYTVAGELPEAKLVRAIKLSRDRYCVVAHLVGGRAEIKYRYRLNGGEWVEVDPEPAE